MPVHRLPCSRLPAPDSRAGSAPEAASLAATAVGVAAATSLAAAWALHTSPSLFGVGILSLLLAAAILHRPEVGALLLVVFVAVIDRELWFDRGLPGLGATIKPTDQFPFAIS